MSDEQPDTSPEAVEEVIAAFFRGLLGDSIRQKAAAATIRALVKERDAGRADTARLDGIIEMWRSGVKVGIRNDEWCKKRNLVVLEVWDAFDGPLARHVDQLGWQSIIRARLLFDEDGADERAVLDKLNAPAKEPNSDG